jgi:MFS family permease
MRNFAPLIAFKVRSYRFQWPADVCANWAFEMETLILGWYILVETNSIIWLTAFGSLQFMGTLIAPWLGVMGDRIGRKIVFCTMRAIFVVLALVLMTLAFLDQLTPTWVLILSLANGMMRPSDMVMRQALVGDTVPQSSLANALGLTRISMDSARVFGALVGAGIFAALGIAYAYILVSAVYLLAFLLSFGVTNTHDYATKAALAKTSQWKDFKEGITYIWNTPAVLAIMALALITNLTAFPIIRGLLPYVAKEVYLIGEIGLGHMVATFSAGALIGSTIIAVAGARTHSTKFMLTNILLWYVMLAVFAAMEDKFNGLLALFVMGIVHALGMVSMSVILVGQLEKHMRGRVIGVRILAIYGVPIGLMGTSYFINVIGFQGTVNLYVAFGIAVTSLIWFKWRKAL